MKLIFATNNQHKVEEIRTVLAEGLEIVTLKEAGIDIDIPEPFHTLEENASAKAKTIYDLTTINCFSEDTGLEVVALNGEPGVKSARYAGDNRSFDAKAEKAVRDLVTIRFLFLKDQPKLLPKWTQKKRVFLAIAVKQPTNW